jgi:hypothetical protein
LLLNLGKKSEKFFCFRGKGHGSVRKTGDFRTGFPAEWNIPVRRRDDSPWAAQGIEAEIPQDLHGQIRGIGAVERGERSTPRFYYPEGFAAQIPLGKKMRPNSSLKKFLIPNPSLFSRLT